ncbi:VOC family protein [Streptomonospora nanhaiensis]|uniref:PhnB protein n=1 Tax=Streptomonospora nanhaiensis TaxID=1323731 RepID=A0A853BNX6_9ACTN|nr:VOC family protein [Streptomonospora nanhaiensis]MBV2365767.1 VOC family protein [Streptomonospora nanhaiensis]MBX9388086.1 VOC family protein [Streptomonospora nanhaiensis]NYI96474.1 PhnB protein [Streptomonospora nanhaiensis]
MSVTTTTHLNFRGEARAALEHYRSVFGGRLTAVTYKDTGAPADGKEADWVVWGEVVGENGFHVMAYDVPSELPWDQGANPFFVSVRGDDADEITALWQKLEKGSTVAQPLGPSQWAPLYGMLTDRFGVTWVLDVAAPYNG